MKNKIALFPFILILILTLFIFNNNYLLPRDANLGLDDLVMLVDNNMNLMPVEDNKILVDHLKRILKVWKNVKFSPKNAFAYNLQEYMDSRLSTGDFSKLQNLDIFHMDHSFIKARIHSYSNEEKAYALKTNKLCEKACENDIFNMYLANAPKVLALRDIHGSKVKEINKLYSLAYLDGAMFGDKYESPPRKRLYITNNYIIDDLKDIPIHTLIRGGYANGSCNDFSHSIVVSSYIFYNQNNIIDINDSFYIKNRVEILAYLIAHEIGHCYFNEKENYLNNKSIMYPVHIFEYKEWLKNVQIK